MILYKDIPHTYEHKETGTSYMSGTKFLGLFQQEKDWDAIAAKFAKKHNKKVKEETGVNPKTDGPYWRAEWKKRADIACERGTKFHLEQEEKVMSMYKGMDKIVCPTDEKDPTIKYSLSTLKLKDGVYPELIVWNNKAMIAGQADLVIIKNNTISVLDYKGLALDTPILTLEGWSEMGKLKIGDIVYDKDGNQTTIKHVSNVHNNPCYKLTFDTNDTLTADHEHKWVIDFWEKKGKYKTVEMTTEELYLHCEKSRKNKKNRSVPSIPRIKCIPSLQNKKEIDLPLDPYVLGLWLGDGSTSCGIISNKNEKIWNELEKRGFKTSQDLNRNQNRSEMRTVYGIRNYLKSANLLNNKHIPDIYYQSSYEQRLDLLRGFMDADGHFNKTRKRFVMVTTQEWQAKEVSSLISSLGWKPTIVKADTKCTNCKDPDKKIKSFHITFSANKNPFLIRNKECMDNIRFNKSYTSHRQLKSIEKIKTVPTICIAVDSPSKTYLAGRNFIATHNTNKKIEIEPYIKWDGSFDRFKPPISHIPDTTGEKYFLQLNLYAYMIKKHNPSFTVGELRLRHIEFDENDNPLSSKDIIAPNYQSEIRDLIEYRAQQLIFE
jgi:hypothetical protein